MTTPYVREMGETGRRALELLRADWPAGLASLDSVVEQFPLGAESLWHLLAFSPISLQKLRRHPEDLVWLADPAISQMPRGYGRISRELEVEKTSRPEGFDPEFGALRRVKSREMLRIAVRELAGVSTLQQTTAELSDLAELCVKEVTRSWLEEMSRKPGRPESGFVVLGMGKLGGRELNYSSDIDLIYFYDIDGALNPRYTYHEFFTRLAENITRVFSKTAEAGSLFRIDLRLRPEGGSGPLVRSLLSMENYYSGFGETWERMAMIKARAVAGDEELAYEFLQRLQPFCFPRALSADLLDEIASVKHRIERDIVGKENLKRHLKLGHGGIREIEFVVQTLQLINGARNAFLQERNTLKALGALHQVDLLPREDVEKLSEAYVFLRNAEHRLQIAEEQQTHILPEDPEELRAVALSLGFADAGAFGEVLSRHTENVRTIFERIMEGRDARSGKAALQASASDGNDLQFFQDAAHAEKDLTQLAANPRGIHASPRSRQLFDRLRPLLIRQLRQVADPDAALTRFVRFVEIYGIRGMLFETLIVNPKLLELLIRLFDSGRFLSEVVFRRPQLIEEITRGGMLHVSMNVAAYRAGFAANEEKLPQTEWMRVYRRGQILRIFLRDVLEIAPLPEIHAEYSALAEAALLELQTLLPSQDEVTVVALGKFGGRELSYGSDLDVIFVGENPAAAAKLTKGMGQQTAEGILFPMDARLRPEGQSSPLAERLSRYASYYESRAQLWEMQALTRARPISGPEKEAFLQLAREVWSEAGQRPNLYEEIVAMHHKVVANRAGTDDYLHFKTGQGGLMSVEFLCQALQMKHQIWETNTLNAIRKLKNHQILSDGHADSLTEAHLFLRKVESVLRRVDNSSVSALPASEVEQKQVARRLKIGALDEFKERYLAARQTIRELFEAVLG